MQGNGILTSYWIITWNIHLHLAHLLGIELQKVWLHLFHPWPTSIGRENLGPPFCNWKISGQRQFTSIPVYTNIYIYIYKLKNTHIYIYLFIIYLLYTCSKFHVYVLSMLLYRMMKLHETQTPRVIPRNGGLWVCSEVPGWRTKDGPWCFSFGAWERPLHRLHRRVTR